jgi:SAM-dependent methyltransferase
MEAESLLREITEYCRNTGVAESTFGRLVVNDGKFVNRLRDGGRITTATLERVRTFMSSNMRAHRDGKAVAPTRPIASLPPVALGAPAPAAESGAPKDRNFRFFDNRQKYLLFVNTCSEKGVVAQRVAMELANIHPRPPAVRVFDAGVGDGTVLTRVMRAMHNRFSTIPFYIVGKEISLEDVRLALEKMPDRYYEHPASVLVMTNLYYREAPWLVPTSVAAATGLAWHELALTGTTAHEFEEQITALGPWLTEHWRAHVSPKTGNPVYERPAVLVIYREDHRFLLDPIIPRRGGATADYDLVMASQPYRLRAPLEFKAERVIAPLARSLGPGGRLLGIHSHGNDPGLEILQNVWPDEQPFQHDRHNILKAVKETLGSAARNLNFNAYSDARSLFRYDMHTLPTEISDSIGTSTLFAAWNAAVYVGQIEDARLEGVLTDRRYLNATSDVLHKHGGLWFWDESYIISRRRD